MTVRTLEKLFAQCSNPMMQNRMNKSLLAIFGWITITATGVSAAPLARDVNWIAGQTAAEQKSLLVPETTATIVIDGKLDDAAWGRAVVIDELLPYGSEDAESPPARVRLLFDRENFYVGMAFYGDDMSKLVLAPQKKPDVWAGHMAEMFLDPTGQGKGRYQFALNAVGTRYDGRSDGGAEWQGQWQGKGSVHADHWEVEFAIPYTDLGLNAPPSGPWLANFARGGSAGFRASWTGAWGEPETLGQLFFRAEAAATHRAQLKPKLALILDREEYDPLDITGVAVARLSKPAPAGAQLTIELTDSAGKCVARQELGEPKELMADLTLDLLKTPLGEYTVKATLMGKNGEVLATSKAPLRKKVRRAQVKVPTRHRIPVNVWPCETSGAPPMSHVAPDVSRGNRAVRGAGKPPTHNVPGSWLQRAATWPITTGVPFPQGALYDADRTRLLDEKGYEVPCQTFVRSLWTRHGSVRWLGLDFQAPLSTNGTKYFLEFGTKVKRAKVKQAIHLTESAEQIQVDTGPLSFVVRKRGFNLLDEVRLNGKEISRQTQNDGLQLTDHEGAIYRAANDAETSVVVEEAGPLRVTIRAEGWYVKDGTKGEKLSPFLPTDKLCKHVTRITAWQGKPYVAVQHNLVITFDSHKVRLRNVAINQRIVDAKGGMFGLDGATVSAPDAPSVRLYQPASDDAQIETGDGEAITVVKAGKRADGWFRTSGTHGGLTLCLTDPWQLFPKELELADSSLWLHVWPKHGRTYTKVNPNEESEIYKAWWCHTGAELNFQMPEDAYQALLNSSLQKGSPAREFFVPRGYVSNAQGVAAENNFLLCFDDGASTTTGKTEQALNNVWQELPHAWADPAWVCDSMVFGWMTPRNEARFGDLEKMFEYSIFARVAAQGFARDYGQFNWFDGHGDNPFRDGRWTLNRTWNNTHHGEARAAWYLYARSGDPRYLQLARRQTRHSMNVDVTHYVTPSYDLFSRFDHPHPAIDQSIVHRTGAMFHVKGITHWGGDSAVLGHYVNFDHILWDYYVTGNRRGLDVTKQWMDAVKARGPVAARGREGTQPIAELTELYKATFDPQVLEVLNAYVQRILNDGPFEKQHVLSFAPFVDRYLPFSGNQLMRQKSVEWGLPRTGHPSGNLAAVLYYETGDKESLKKLVPEVYLGGLRIQDGPIEISSDMTLDAWHGVTYFISYSQPFLRALVDANIPLEVASLENQLLPSNADVLLKKQADEEVGLEFSYAGARAIPVTLISPEGKTVMNTTLPAKEKGKEEAVLESVRHPELTRPMSLDPPLKMTIPKDGGAGLYRLVLGTEQAPLDNSTPVLFPFAPRPMVCVLEPGRLIHLYGRQMWYFRAAPEQRTVELEVRTRDRHIGIQVQTADGKAALTRFSLVKLSSHVIQANVTPGEMYRLVCNGFAAIPIEVKVLNHPLVLARTPEEWFAPPSPAKAAVKE